MSKLEARSRSASVEGTTHIPSTVTDQSNATTSVAKGASPPRAAQSKKTSRLPILVSLAALLASALFLLSRSNGTGLPSSYALCSREGKIYTVDEAKPRVECCVVHQGRIADTGSISEVRSRWGDREHTGPVAGAPQVSAKEGLKFIFVKRGSIVLPGLADAHGHIMEYGFKRQLELDGSDSVAEVIQRIRSYILTRPEIVNDTTQWISGMGWDQNRWTDPKFPTAADLDQDPLLHGRPIALTRVDGHASWVSPAVLEVNRSCWALQLMKSLPKFIDGGQIIRYKNGTATGIFVDNAMALIPRPKWTKETLKQYFTTAMRDAVSYGLTSIHDAGTYPEHIQFYKEMADDRMLPIRLYLMGHVESNDYWGSQIPRLHNYGGGRLTVRSIKLIADGALGSWGAAMLKPYTDNQKSRGTLLIPPKALSSLINKFLSDSWQVNVHCIGDHANHVVLDIFEKALRGRNSSAIRPRIEHAQIMTPTDLNRTGHLGIIASVQPTHATSDMWYAEQRLGSERLKGAYAYQTLLQRSKVGVLPLGSDFPIESINPLLGFYAAVSRLSTDGTSPHGPGGWFPSERLTREQALKGMTRDAAYASFAETEIGSIVPGLRADLVVLDTDIMSVSADLIPKTKVTSTIIDGALVYGGLT